MYIVCICTYFLNTFAHIHKKMCVCLQIDRWTERQTDRHEEGEKEKVKYVGIYAWDTCRA